MLLGLGRGAPRIQRPLQVRLPPLRSYERSYFLKPRRPDSPRLRSNGRALSGNQVRYEVSERSTIRKMSSSKALSGLTGMRRGAHHAFIALGSNLGDRIDNIEKALDAMRGQGLQITRISSLYETQAMYYENQGNFLNGVCMVWASR